MVFLQSPPKILKFFEHISIPTPPPPSILPPPPQPQPHPAPPSTRSADDARAVGFVVIMGNVSQYCCMGFLMVRRRSKIFMLDLKALIAHHPNVPSLILPCRQNR